jgi:hypothetical protein
LTNILLLLIALALLAIAVRPIFIPKPVQAESHPEHRLFVEPGVQVLHNSDLSRNVYGRVVIASFNRCVKHYMPQRRVAVHTA